MSTITIQSSRPFIEVDGVKHLVEWKEARMLELLLAARGEILSYEHLQHALQTPKGCLWVYASKIRAIIEPYGWRVTPDIDIGYRVTKAG